MTAIPFPVSSSPGERPQEGAGRLINATVVKTEQGARFPFKWIRTAGLRLGTTIDSVISRGFLETNNTLIDIRQNNAYAVTRSSSGVYTKTTLGHLGGSLPVTVARNNKSPTPDIVAVSTDSGTWSLTLSGVPTAFADPDLPSANSVSSYNNYFIFTHASGRISASGLNAVTVASNSFTTARGGLRRGVQFGSFFIAFGRDFFEIYRDAATSPFPLERVDTVNRGIAGTFAVAGWEEGGASQLIWAADDDTVVRFAGSAPPVVVSNEDVQRAIAQTTDKTLLEACTYTANGVSYWSLTNPGEWTWELNLSTSTWQERTSDGRDDWRVRRTIRAFGLWLGGDRATGALYEIDPTYYKEGTSPLVWEIESGALAAFPARLGGPRAQFDFTAALGDATGSDPIETDPQVDISWSRDGGYSYGNPLMRSLGAQGVSNQVVRISSLGMAKGKGYRFRLRVSDPVPVCLMGADVIIEKRAA